VLGCVALLSACEAQSASPPAASPPASPYGPVAYGGYGQPPYQPGYQPSPYGQPYYSYPSYPGGGAPQPPPYSTPPYAPPPSPYPPATAGPPVAPSPAPLPVSTADPISSTDVPWLRQHAAAVMRELVAALPEDARQRVQSIPLDVDDTPGEVNAFATCKGSIAAMVVTDGLLDIVAHLSQARANDDVFGTHDVDEYIRFIAARQKPNQPVASPPPGFFDPRQEGDPRRVARQHDVLDETLGFILGHELAHHHLGHLPCTGGPGPFGMGELVRGLSGSVPVFNQPNELAADTAGTDTVLAAGARRPGYHLTEGGALMVMQFFSASDQLSPEDILFGFERTHPPPAFRIPVIEQTAAAFRMTGGAWVPLLRL